jgi:dihydrofolate reductase
MATFKAIAAMAKNRVIGKENKLPWHLPEDFKFFKQQTIGQHLIMGRKTFENVGVLSKRAIWVMTRTNTYGWDELSQKNSLVKIVTKVEDLVPQVPVYWVCGGAEIYKMFLPQISEFYVTEIQKDYEGDALMPAFEDQFKKKDLVLENSDFKIFKYYERA